LAVILVIIKLRHRIKQYRHRRFSFFWSCSVIHF